MEDKVEIDAADLQSLKEEIASVKEYSDTAYRMRKVLRQLKAELNEKKLEVKELNAKIKEIGLDLEEHLDDNPMDRQNPLLPWGDDTPWEEVSASCLDLPRGILDAFEAISVCNLREVKDLIDGTPLEHLSEPTEEQMAVLNQIEEWGEGRISLIEEKLEAIKQA